MPVSVLRNPTVSVNVLDYGADKSGNTDSTAAFNAAMTIIKNAGNGDLLIPSGKYLLAAGWVIQSASNFSIRAERGAILWIGPNTVGSPSAGTRNMLTIADCSDFSLNGVVVDGRRDTIMADQLVQANISAGATTVTVVDGTKYVVGEKITICGGRTISAGAEQNRVDANRVISGIAGNVLTFGPATSNAYTSGAGGAYVTRYQTASGNVVAGRTGGLSGENQQNGIHLLGCTRFTIRNCVGKNVWESPIKMGTGFEYSSGFYGQTVSGGGYTGPADGCSFGNVSDNTCTHGLDQGVSVWCSERIIVKGNLCDDAGWAGVSLTQSHDCTVADNVLSNNAYHYPGDTGSGSGFAIEGGARNVVKGNVMKNNYARAIFANWCPMSWGIVFATPPTLAAAYTRATSSLQVSSSAQLTVGCEYSIYDGIRSEKITIASIPDGTHITLVSPTRFFHASGTQVGPPIAEDNVFTDNTMSGSQTADAVLINAAVRSRFKGNTIVGNYGAAFQLPVVFTNYGATLKTGAYGCMVQDNQISDNGAGTNVPSILVDSVTDIDVIGNTIVGSRTTGGGGHGIDFKGVIDGRILDNHIAECGNAGIMLETGSNAATPKHVVVAGNTSVRNNNEGIIITAGSEVAFKQNIANNNNSNGLDLRNVSRCIATGNICTGNNTRGIQLQNVTYSQVQHNICSDDGTGIAPNTGAAQVQTYGIDENGTSNNNQITFNSCTGNSSQDIQTVGAATLVAQNQATNYNPASLGLLTPLTASQGNGIAAGGNIEAFSRVGLNTCGYTRGNATLVLFTADITTTVANLLAVTRNAANTPTLCRMGIYSISGDTATLVARTANDTSMFASGYNPFKRALATAGGYPANYTFVAGQRYALALICVGGSADPSFYGTPGYGDLVKLSPQMVSFYSAQSDLATTYSISGGSPYCDLPYICAIP